VGSSPDFCSLFALIRFAISQSRSSRLLLSRGFEEGIPSKLPSAIDYCVRADEQVSLGICILQRWALYLASDSNRI